jgi:hypothetical protein
VLRFQTHPVPDVRLDISTLTIICHCLYFSWPTPDGPELLWYASVYHATGRLPSIGSLGFVKVSFRGAGLMLDLLSANQPSVYAPTASADDTDCICFPTAGSYDDWGVEKVGSYERARLGIWPKQGQRREAIDSGRAPTGARYRH